MSVYSNGCKYISRPTVYTMDGKQIGKDNFGLYTLATSLISMFLLDFGLSAAVSVLFLNITQKEIKKVQITCLGSPIKFIF